jgi:hypothetical protein
VESQSQPMTDSSSPARRNERAAKVAFAVLALGSALVAVAVYLLRATLGISDETARLIATAFILAAVADALVLFLWDRIFKRPR